jgi:succinate dehydrogenase (ubiquinone) membrane anchor subunit
MEYKQTVFVYYGFLSRGIEAVVIDYVRPIVFGSVISKLALGAVYLLSIVTLAGLLFFITNDVGIVLAIKQFWKL